VKIVNVMLVVALLGLLATGPVIAQTGSLSLDAPVGGEQFYNTRDTTLLIRWSGVDDTTRVRLEYSSNNGSSWKLMHDSASGLQYVWDIKGLPTSTLYRVRVLQLRPPGSQDNVIYSGHGGPVADAWWSPGFNRVVSVSADAHVWDASMSSSVPLVLLPVPRATYSSVRWSKDSSRIITGSDDNTARLVDAAANTLTQTYNHPDVVSKVELDPTGQWMFTKCNDNRVRVFNLPTTLARATHTAGSTLEDMAMNADGTKVVLSANEARVFARAVGLPLAFAQHTVGIISAAWSPDGKTICSVGGDATIRLWNSTTAVQLWSSFDTKEGVRSVVFSPDGALVAVGMADSTVTLWNTADGKRVYTFGGYKGAVRMVAFSPDGTLLAGASDDNFARVHELTSNSTILRCQHNDDVGVVRWDSSGTRILTTSRDGTARIWQVRPITLQADSSGTFSIAPPPPAFARFTVSGDTLNIRDVTTVTVRVEGTQFIDLADIDSVRLRFSYDPSMLLRTNVSVPVSNVIDDVITDTNGIRRSRQYFECTLALPFIDQDLMTVSFQATLGQDSISGLSVIRVDQIGSGTGMRTETRSEAILVRGICTSGDGARLYTSLGTPLEVKTASLQGGLRVHVTLAELGTTDLVLSDLQGRLVWKSSATILEQQNREFERIIPNELMSGLSILVVTTPTEVKSVLVVGGAR